MYAHVFLSVESLSTAYHYDLVVAWPSFVLVDRKAKRYARLSSVMFRMWGEMPSQHCFKQTPSNPQHSGLSGSDNQASPVCVSVFSCRASSFYGSGDCDLVVGNARHTFMGEHALQCLVTVTLF